MDTIDAVRQMVDGSGLTHRQIARQLGRYDTWVSQILTRGRDPQVSTLADVAQACGYRLQLVPMDGGDTITIGEEDHDDGDAGAQDPVVQARALVHRAAALLDDMEA